MVELTTLLMCRLLCFEQRTENSLGTSFKYNFDVVPFVLRNNALVFQFAGNIVS